MSYDAENDEQKPTSVAAWKKAAVHYPLLPSGVRVGIKIPDLPRLIEVGTIPQHLLEAAIGVASGQQALPTKELIVQQREFTDLTVQLTVTEPKLSEADVEGLPYEDKELIVALATRQRDIDAEGEHIAGLSTSEKFRRFRKLGEFDSPLGDL
jgi:hypothetical protein